MVKELKMQKGKVKNDQEQGELDTTFSQLKFQQLFTF